MPGDACGEGVGRFGLKIEVAAAGNRAGIKQVGRGFRNHFDVGAILQHDRQTPVIAIPRRGNQPLGHFFLQHEKRTPDIHT